MRKSPSFKANQQRVAAGKKPSKAPTKKPGK